MNLVQRYKNWVKEKDYGYFIERSDQTVKLMLISLIPTMGSMLFGVVWHLLVGEDIITDLVLSFMLISIVACIPFLFVCCLFQISSRLKYTQVYPKIFATVIENTIQKVKHETMARILAEHNTAYRYDATQFWNGISDEHQKWWEYYKVYPVQYRRPHKKSLLDKTKKERLNSAVSCAVILSVCFFTFFEFLYIMSEQAQILFSVELWFFTASVASVAMSIFIYFVWFAVNARKQQSKRKHNRVMNHILEKAHQRAKEELEEEHGIYYQSTAPLEKLYKESKEELYEFY